mmetsp:Transcript_43900/g.117206  ORF Transcript_43900/g.117206 Transcript_43900/m.117206 type:complete len:164 (+) Transcript_43900:1-492(+)
MESNDESEFFGDEGDDEINLDDFYRDPWDFDEDFLAQQKKRPYSFLITGKPGSGKATLASRLAERLGCVYVGLPQILSDALAGRKIASELEAARKMETVEGESPEDGIASRIKQLEEEMARLPRNEEETPESQIDAVFQSAASTLLRGEAVSGESLDQLIKVS